MTSPPLSNLTKEPVVSYYFLHNRASNELDQSLPQGYRQRHSHPGQHGQHLLQRDQRTRALSVQVGHHARNRNVHKAAGSETL